MLLAILAGVVFAVFGAGLRMRLLLTVALIAAYVPVAGAGPSIAARRRHGGGGDRRDPRGPARRPRLPRAAGGGAARSCSTPGSGPTSAGSSPSRRCSGSCSGRAAARPAARPARRPAARAAGRPARRGRRPDARRHGRDRAADGAPLRAGSRSPRCRPTCWSLPAVAPVMWIGMLLGLAGQLPIAPAEPLGAVEGWLIDYVSRCRRGLRRPRLGRGRSLPLPGAAQRPRRSTSRSASSPPQRSACSSRRSGLAAPRGIVLAGSAALLVALLVVARPEPGARRVARSRHPADHGTRRRPGRLDPARAAARRSDPRRRRPARGRRRARPCASAGSSACAPSS